MRATHYYYPLALMLAVLLGACMSRPLVNESNAAPPNLRRIGLLPETYRDATPKFTCYALGSDHPKDCVNPEVQPNGYFQRENIKKLYSHEWLKPATPPLVGLALSGGGTKAGDYALGILAGVLGPTRQFSKDNLSIRQKTQQIDVISSVSGGSYAALWYFSRLIDFYAKLRELDIGDVLDSESDDAPGQFVGVFKDCLPRRYCKYWSESDGVDLCPLANSNFISVKVAKVPKVPDCPAQALAAIDPNDRNRLSDPYRFQNQLRGFQDLFSKHFEYESTSQTPAVGRRIAKEILLTLPTLPFHYLAHGLLDLKDVTLSLSARRYYIGIDRTYAAAPVDCANIRKYASQACLLGAGDRPAPNTRSNRGHTMNALNTLYFFQTAIADRIKDLTDGHVKEQNLPQVPFWIANTTAGVSPEPLNAGAEMPDLEDSVFEMTPVSFGSRHYGWWNGTPPRFELARIAGASGSFLDGQQRDFSGIRRPIIASLLWAANLNWGVNLANPRYQDSVRTQHAFLPWPLNWAHHRHRNHNGAWIHLSDGGMSDNLGMWSLIRRSIPVIVAADSAQDDNGNFADLCRLQTHLNRRKLYLHMPQLIGFQNFCAQENSTYDLWNWPVELSWLEGCVSKSSDDSLCMNSQELISRIVLLKPAINWGKILPHIKSCEEVTQCPQALKNLRTVMPNFPTELFGFLVANQKLLRANGKPVFPQHSTVLMTLNSSPWLYGAYRELAQWQTRGLNARLTCLRVEANLRTLGVTAPLPRDCRPNPSTLIQIPQLN